MIDALGWIGTIAVLGAYAMVAAGYYPVHVFHWANVAGAPLIGASAVVHGAWPAFAITAAFGLIGGLSVWQGAKERAKSARGSRR